MGKFICIHGHFYQPPRENPWLECVELQSSAAPYHDWNERVTSECYAPNARARVLDLNGKIGELVNNYAMISFNFGPTLLSWMREAYPEIHNAIVEADEVSCEIFSGHGSALAQVYNHMIMPLANLRDKRTQVQWGIRDFKHRFGRAPEGMWLPETAVDTETLECLVERGITFTILAPSQAAQVRPLDSDEWLDVNGGKIDPRRPYLCKLPSGRSISLFFYDGPTSRAVAFENLLDDGGRFADRLEECFSKDGSEGSEDQLVHIATDGESYGHHHRYADMALAWALRRITHNNGIKLTNYGAFLKEHPAKYEVRIHERTAWSCVHGVGRWHTDCGCNSGGYPHWHQSWRGPLRNALDWLRDVVSPLFESQAARYFTNPWVARDDYVSVLLNRSPESVTAFLSRQASRALESAERSQAIKLMEMQRHAMLMYTSCGWFFDEISGIETVQVIEYAGRVVQLAREIFGLDLEPAFLERLQEAKSNLPEHSDGASIYRKWVKPAMVDWNQATAHYAIGSLFLSATPKCKKVFVFDFADEEREVLSSGKTRLAIGRTRARSEITEESAQMCYAVFYMGEQNLTAGVREFRSEEEFRAMMEDLKQAFAEVDFPKVIRCIARHFGESCYSLKSLFKDEEHRVLSELLAATRADLESRYRRIAERYVPLMSFLGESGKLQLPAVEMAANFVLRVDLHRQFAGEMPSVMQLRRLFEQAKEKPGLFFDAELSYAVKNRMEAMISAIASNPMDVGRIRTLVEVAELVSQTPLDLNPWKVQNTYWEMLHWLGPEMVVKARGGDEEANNWLAEFRRLGDQLGFNTSDLLK